MTNAPSSNRSAAAATAMSTTVLQDAGRLNPSELQSQRPLRRRRETIASTTRIGTSLGTTRSTLCPITIALPIRSSSALSQRARGASGC